MLQVKQEISHLKKRISFSGVILDSLMFLLSFVGYFHVYGKTGTKRIIKIISIIYSFSIVSLVTVCGVMEMIGAYLPPRVPFSHSLLAAILPIFYFYGPVIMIATFVQSFDKGGYYNLIERIKSSTVHVKMSTKISIGIIGVIEIGMLGLSIPDFLLRMNYTKDTIKASLSFYHSYTSEENMVYGYFVYHLAALRSIVFSMWIMCCALYLVQIICLLLSNQFKLCTQKLKQITGNDISQIEDIITKYEELRSLVKTTDELFMILNGVMMSYSIFSVCSMGYLIMVVDTDWPTDIYIKYIIYGVMNLVFICVIAAYLNTCVSRILYNLKLIHMKYPMFPFKGTQRGMDIIECFDTVTKLLIFRNLHSQ